MVTPEPASDPFGCSAIRSAVLDGWAASPARFREDANAEEDLVLGSYRDRLLVELLQNAVDAAAPVRSRVAVSLTGSGPAAALVIANTGHPLTAEGVQALSTLRASAKRDQEGAVGRFGVGFAAVLAVTAAPMVASRSGAVEWSAGRTRSLVGALPGAGAELARRDGGVPVLRLPFDVAVLPDDVAALLAEGYDTVVRLPLRTSEARVLAERLLEESDPALLLVLPGLAELNLAGRVSSCQPVSADASRGSDVVLDGVRWRGLTATGELPLELLVDRPVEERARTSWAISAWVPVDADGAVLDLPVGLPHVLRSPQPTDEPISLPIVLSVPVPLEPGRRHSHPGPLRDWLLSKAADVVADLLVQVSPTPAALALVPTGLAAGVCDAHLRAALVTQLPRLAWLPEVSATGEDPPATRLRGQDAIVVDLGSANAAFVEVLGGELAGLLGPDWSPRSSAWSVLGAQVLDTAAVVELLAGLERPPTWWGRVHTALADAPDRDALGGLPVPLADGRLASGARGLLLAAAGVDVASLREAGVRLPIVHPDAAVPALVRLGALESTAAAVLATESVRSAVETSLDEPRPTLADAVLGLVASSGISVDELAWLGLLALPDADGEWWAARDLILAGSPLAEVLDPAEAVSVDEALVTRWGAGVLTSVGVAASFAVAHLAEVVLSPDHIADDETVSVDSIEDWAEETLDRIEADTAAGYLNTEGATDRSPASLPPTVLELVVIRDLDLVDPERWGTALALLADDPLTRRAVVEAARVRVAGQLLDVPSYAAWWLGRQPVIDGRRPAEVLVPDSDARLIGLYEEAPPGLDAGFLVALGAASDLDTLLEDDDTALDLLDRLGDASRAVGVEQARQIYAAAARALEGIDADPPLTVRAFRAGLGLVVPGAEAVIVDAPDLVPLLAGRPLTPAPLAHAAALATILGVPLASSLADYEVVSVGVPRPLVGGGDYHHHAALLVRDAAGEPRTVSWRVIGDEIHATGPEGLGRALAWCADAWGARAAYVARLRDPDEADLLVAESILDDV